MLLNLPRVRVVTQAFFLAVTLFLVLVTEFGSLRGYPVSVFLEVDPLVAVATTIATHRLYHGLVWSLVVLVPTLLLGRVFCGWICPFGTLHQLVGWLFNRRERAARIASNGYLPMFGVKYYLLVALVVAAALGSVQIGWLDPLCTLLRTCTVALLPAVDLATGWVYLRPAVHQFAWVVGLLSVVLIAANLKVPRLFCRVLCPLGAGLGVLSRWGLWRIDRNLDRCVDCRQCLARCEGAADPQARLRRSECFVCLNCLDDCPHEALAFRFLPPLQGEVAAPDTDRRRLVFGGVVSVLAFAFARRSGDLDRTFAKEALRPPGSLAEAAFLERCLKCEQCVRVCPTNVLQPALLETGIEGLWTPVLKMRVGYCELNCTLCGQVCPTGAIQPITLEQKRGTGDFTATGPIRLGTAFYDQGRCLPWAMDTPCVVCEEVCPTSPKAIHTREVVIEDRDGRSVRLRRPYVDPLRCIGCGICEHECPVKDQAAIRVTAAGESRAPERSLLLPPSG